MQLPTVIPAAFIPIPPAETKVTGSLFPDHVETYPSALLCIYDGASTRLSFITCFVSSFKFDGGQLERFVGSQLKGNLRVRFAILSDCTRELFQSKYVTVYACKASIKAR